MTREDIRKQSHKTREAVLEIATRECGEGEDKKTEECVRASISSEAPCVEIVYDREARRWIRANEVLGHGDGEVDFTRCANGLIIQDTHDGDQIGIIRKVQCENGKLRGDIEFCCGQRAQEIKRDALAGIRRNMSVGYFVKEWTKISDGDREAGTLPTYRAVKWTPYEASFVNIPADTQVGVGRELLDVGDEQTAAETAANPNERKSEMDKPVETPAVETPAVDFAAELRSVKDEIAKVRAIAEKPQAPAPKATPIFDEQQTRTIAKRFSLARAVMGMVKDSGVDNGFERECSQQIEKATGRSAQGLFIPEAAIRTMTGKTNVSDHITGSGANSVATELLAAQYIDALVAQTVLGQAGVQTMAGLVGDIDIPTVSAVTAGWQGAEDGDGTTVAPVFGKISGTPHTITGTAIVTRRLMKQSSLGVDALISRLIIEAIGRGIETAAFEGSGSDGQPTGLASVTGVETVSMTAGKPTKANLVAFWEKVLSNNAGTDALKYIMSPAVKALLCKTPDITLVKNAAGTENVGGVGGYYLCDREGKVEGYDVLTSGLCGSKKIYFGNWSDLILAFWTGIDLIVDPYTYSAKSALQLSAFQDCDILCRHGGAFAIGTAMS